MQARGQSVLDKERSEKGEKKSLTESFGGGGGAVCEITAPLQCTS